MKFKEAKLQQWVTVGKPSQPAEKIYFPRPEQIHFPVFHVPEAHFRHYVNNFSEDEIMEKYLKLSHLGRAKILRVQIS